MNISTIWIKGMVCPRCIRVVNEDLEAAGYSVQFVALGKAVIEGVPDIMKIKEILEKSGFALLEDEEEKIVENTKLFITELLDSDYFENNFKTNSSILEKKLELGYHKLSRIFSSIAGTTLERYIIIQKIDKAKEFIKYSTLGIEEVAFKLGYSSAAHFSNQFKELTGFNPSAFRTQFSQQQK